MARNTRFESFEVFPRLHATLPPTTVFQLSDYDQLLRGNHTTPCLVFPFNGDRNKEVKHFCTGLQNVITCIPLIAGLLLSNLQGRISVLRRNHEPIKLNVQYLDTDRAFPSYEDLANQNYPTSFFTTHAPLLTPPDQDLAGLRRDTGCPVAVFQVNFITGGIILTLALHHLCGDAKSIDHIYGLWAESTKAAATGTVMPKFSPLLDRTYFNASAIPPSKEEIASARAEIKGYVYHKLDKDGAGTKGPNMGTQPPISINLYHFPSTAFAELKKLCTPPPDDPKVPFVSSYDVMAGLTLRCMTRARLPDLKLDMHTAKVAPAHAVDVRNRFPKFVPNNYFGNAFNMTAGEQIPVAKLVGDGGLQAAAHAYRRSINSVHERWIPNVLNVRRAVADEEDMQWDYRPETVTLTSWTHLRVREVYDFGFGLPAALRLPAAPYVGVAVAMPPTRGKDGVVDGFDVVVGLEIDAQKRLEGDVEWNRYCSIVGR